MSDEELYDEFGNLIGEEELVREVAGAARGDEIEGGHLDKPVEQEHGTTAMVKSDWKRTYGDEVEVLVETSDRQATDEPLVQVKAEHSRGPTYTVFTHLLRNVPKTTFDRDYMLGMLEVPERIRNVAVIGSLNSGKTSLVDLFVMESHRNLPHMTANIRKGWKPLRYLDNSRIEIERGVSMKLNGFTFLATDFDMKSIAINLLDAPGHVNFMDQMAVALAAVDCALICVDLVEGVTSPVEKLIKECYKRSVTPIFVLNKMDRLILELKLPPVDAYLKIRHVVQQINSFTRERFSPELGNIIFASAKLRFTFTIEQFVRYHYSSQLSEPQIEKFVSGLWGNVSFEKGQFRKLSIESAHHCSFVQFILLPLYKIFTHSLSGDRENLRRTMSKAYSIDLDPDCLKYDPQPLLKEVLTKVFRDQRGLIKAIARCPDPSTGSKARLLNKSQESSSLLKAHVLQTIDYGGTEWSLVRIYSGKVTSGMRVRVIDSADSQACMSDDDNQKHVDLEDYPSVTIAEIALLGGRYLLPVSQATTGQIVLVKGVSEVFTKSATMLNDHFSDASVFEPIDYINEPALRIAIQPLKPTELPKLLSGLAKVSRYYPGVIIKVEESGEQVILGFGELYLDSLLYDLRNHYAGIEIKLSNPLTIFSESCYGESFAAIPATTVNGTTALSIAAERMDTTLVKDLMRGHIEESEMKDRKLLRKRLRDEYGWDSLAARNVMCFYNNNVLIDDTLPDETNKELLKSYESQIKQGFDWVTREGPLAEEPIHGVQFKILQATGLENIGIGGQLIPLVKKACCIAMMSASPVLLEPIYEVDVLFKSALQPIVEELFKKRRGGRIYKCDRIVGTPLTEIRGQIPVIESIGFETDLRLATRGGSMCQLHFWNKIWRKVPGDVLDKDAPMFKLKPAPINSLSRDFVMKTRRRKGISNEGFMSNDGPSIEKYVDEETFKQLKENGLVT
ncbi:hypothetical protein HG536_0A02110 [Torulaspora globosa]|uniref:Tr-type G domain-containing protein n=1 Tax=Torulaspora globosa TaxID=48254 RepID=A0A7G3ZA58_9SACH|nr:uncharacterized protein HG536_0A02110 [Torulaspora globosa]QLL30394.1 hypothetical protein HG536_0A02110 [Torulaspora globosa]